MIGLVELLISGLGIGSMYALIALGFVIIYRATDVINFAQPALMIMGSFFVSWFARSIGLPFWLAVVAAMVAVAAIAAGCERVAMRPMVGRPVFSAALVTVGIFFALLMVAQRLLGVGGLPLGDPWGFDRTTYQLWRIGLTAVTFLAVGVFLSKSRLGIAMRATSLDQEVSLAQGINVGRMFSLAWIISGATAGLAGMMVGMGGSNILHFDAFDALKALPVIILGGLDSMKGAYIAGLLIGIIEALSTHFSGTIEPVMGHNFHLVVPYVVMLLVLMVRPYGFFGTPEVERV